MTTTTMLAEMAAALRREFPTADTPDWVYYEECPSPRPLSHRPYGGYLPTRGRSASAAIHTLTNEFLDSLLTWSQRFDGVTARELEGALLDAFWGLGEQDLWREMNRVAADDYPETAFRTLSGARNRIAAVLKPIRDAERQDRARRAARAMAAIAAA